MPRLETFRITLKTGSQGKNEPPRYAINGFPLDFEEAQGGVEAGGSFEATGNPGSYPHSLVLVGPDTAPWDLESIEITYFFDGQEPYTVRLGMVTLDTDSDLNLLYEQPLPTFNV